MSTPADPSSAPLDNRWPPQIKYILGNEAAERFSYYGMKSILAIYITSMLLKTEDQATGVIHLFGFANYFMPLLGAWVSDRFWGRYNTILWISLSYCLGHGVMALSDAIPSISGKVTCLWFGLGLIAFGSGGIKPCVSAFVGDQFKPEQRHLLQKAYAAFYWSINLGSTASFFIIPFLRKEYGYSWAFGVPGLAMALATFIFWLGTKHYVRVPPTSQTRSAGFLKVFIHALRNQKLRQPGQRFWDVSRSHFKESEVDAASSVLPILGIFALIPIFWSLFDQTFSTWVLQGEQMRPYFTTSALVAERDIRDVNGISASLATNASVRFLQGKFTPATLQKVTNSALEVRLRREAAAEALNGLIQSRTVMSTQELEGVKFSADTRFLLGGIARGEDPERANRLVLEDSFPNGLSKCYRIGPEEMLSVNSILVMIFVPIMTLLVYPILGRFASPLRRMSYGMFLAALSFVLVAVYQKKIEHGEGLSIFWQIGPYIILTMAEVLVSTTGLEFAFREAAPEMKSIIMGFWNLTIALGNLFVTVITALATKLVGKGAGGHGVSVTPTMFLFYAGLTFVVAIAFSIIATLYTYRDSTAAQGK
ncbi:MAG: proton-dependent oligopeptide transporter, family [Verrucomicrobiota bacterium]